MPFSSYKSISAVAKKFQLKYVLSDYIVGIELPVKAAFKEELDLLFTDGVVDIIYVFLQRAVLEGNFWGLVITPS